MNPPKPHFLLFCEGNLSPQELAAAPSKQMKGSVAKAARWRFVLENVTTGEKFEANDLETSCTPDRASLVAVLRGLEALEQPSKVTLVTNNRYVFRGLRYGLAEWRENDFAWEHFGAVQPIRNSDVWRRIDRTLSYHEVQCRWMAMGDSHKSSHADSGEIKLSPSTATEVAQSLSIVESQLANVSHVHQEATSANRAAASIYKDSSASDYQESTNCDAGSNTLEEALDSSLNIIEQGVYLQTGSTIAPQQSSKDEIASRYRSSQTIAMPSGGSVTRGEITGVMTEKQSGETADSDSIAKVDVENGTKNLSHEIPTTVKPNANLLKTDSPQASLTKSEDVTDEPRKGLSLLSALIYPFAICWSLCKRALLAVWEAILRLDEGVESYLRCMFLLDPRQYRRRK